MAKHGKLFMKALLHNMQLAQRAQIPLARLRERARREGNNIAQRYLTVIRQPVRLV